MEDGHLIRNLQTLVMSVALVPSLLRALENVEEGDHTGAENVEEENKAISSPILPVSLPHIVVLGEEEARRASLSRMLCSMAAWDRSLSADMFIGLLD